MSEGMKIFLSKLDLSDVYTDNFVRNGYDKVQDICQLDIEDLDIIKVLDEEHRTQILQGAEDFKTTHEYRLLKWLEESGLSRYGMNFIHNDFLDLEDIGHLEVENNLYDDLEIVLPGHRKRLKTAAVTLLCKRRRLSSEPEEPVALGYWKRPQKLQDSKNPFLCIDATIKSTKPHGKSRSFEFMVDSGSDVATISQQDLDQLDLELLGTIKSRGVHSTKDKQLYRAKLLVGNEEIETEVIPETYESIGNHAFRQFRHFINGQTHYWLKGNTRKPPSADESFLRRTPESTAQSTWKCTKSSGSPESAQGSSTEKNQSPELVCLDHRDRDMPVSAAKKALLFDTPSGASSMMHDEAAPVGRPPTSEGVLSKETELSQEVHLQEVATETEQTLQSKGERDKGPPESGVS